MLPLRVDLRLGLCNVRLINGVVVYGSEGRFKDPSIHMDVWVLAVDADHNALVVAGNKQSLVISDSRHRMLTPAPRRSYEYFATFFQTVRSLPFWPQHLKGMPRSYR
jgi:hypothetical protein